MPDRKPIHEIRRRQLQRLVQQRFHGVQAAFATEIQRQADIVSGLLRGKRNLGETLARTIEAKVHLPAGWLDQDGLELPRQVLAGMRVQEATSTAYAIQPPTDQEVRGELLVALTDGLMRGAIDAADAKILLAIFRHLAQRKP